MKHFIPETLPRKPILGAYKYTLKMFSPYAFLLSDEDREDILMAAVERSLLSIRCDADEREIFLAARRGAENEIRAIINPRIRGWAHGSEDMDVPLLKIARVLYAGLKKKGPRGRRSAAIKAFVLYHIMNPRRWQSPENTSHRTDSRYKLIASVSLTLNQRHWLTAANVKRHYQSALALLFGGRKGSISR